MGREDDALAIFSSQALQQGGDAVAVGDIEERGRLVEKQVWGVLGQCPRHHDALALAVAHRVECATCIVGHACEIGRAHV